MVKLKKIEKQEVTLWDTVELLIKEKNTKSYEYAIKMLQDLKELSIYKKRFNDFCKKIQIIKSNYSKLSGLQWRIEASKLTKK